MKQWIVLTIWRRKIKAAAIPFLIFCYLLGFSAPSFSNEKVRIRIVTNLGNFTVLLLPRKSPKTVENILKYVDEGFYTDVIFHRVIKSFMVQTGYLTKDAKKKKTTHAAIKNEAINGLKNVRGTISMARGAEPHSASSQFFINTKNNPHLDFTSQNPKGWGYAVFGKVISGMNVVGRIERQQTNDSNLPIKPIVIKRISRI
jgi:cyclophilin family peptidyl-prolyl cis-trans isomerase